MYDNYADACEATVTAEQARLEIKKHSGSTLDALMLWKDFVKANGNCNFYAGQMVLDFLGY